MGSNRSNKSGSNKVYHESPANKLIESNTSSTLLVLAALL